MTIFHVGDVIEPRLDHVHPDYRYWPPDVQEEEPWLFRWAWTLRRAVVIRRAEIIRGQLLQLVWWPDDGTTSLVAPHEWRVAMPVGVGVRRTGRARSATLVGR